jgi:hypothetical protein
MYRTKEYLEAPMFRYYLQKILVLQTHMKKVYEPIFKLICTNSHRLMVHFTMYIFCTFVSAEYDITLGTA